MKWNILAVDDDPSVGRQIKDFLDGSIRINGKNDELAVDVMDNFDEALGELDKMLYDIVILDVFKGKVGITIKTRPGENILEEIRKRCFTPVIFYTALPKAVEDKKSDLVYVVYKTAGGLNKLKEAVVSLINTGLPMINRLLIKHFFRVQGEYMWNFVEPNWRTFTSNTDMQSLAYLLSRRLAWSLSRENIHYLIDSLGGSAVTPSVNGDLVHPIEYYIYPPIGTQYNMGDILGNNTKKRKNYCIILTPSCDMVQEGERKAKSEYILVAACIPLPETEEGKEWLQEGSAAQEKTLIEFMKNNKRKGQKERYYFLPGTFFLPNLFVDFQTVYTIPFDEMKRFEKITTLDSPFAECLLNRFCRYIGRIGTPDINKSEIASIVDSVHRAKKKRNKKQ